MVIIAWVVFAVKTIMALIGAELILVYTLIALNFYCRTRKRLAEIIAQGAMTHTPESNDSMFGYYSLVPQLYQYLCNNDDGI